MGYQYCGMWSDRLRGTFPMFRCAVRLFVERCSSFLSRFFQECDTAPTRVGREGNFTPPCALFFWPCLCYSLIFERFVAWAGRASEKVHSETFSMDRLSAPTLRLGTCRLCLLMRALAGP